MASLGIRGGLKQEGRSAFYRWQRSRSIAEVSGSVPRHAMWGSDSRVEWKERGAHCSLAAGKGNMNGIWTAHPVKDLSLFIFCLSSLYVDFVAVLFFLISHIERSFCGLSVAEYCRPASRTTDASFLFTAFSGYERDHQWHQRHWSRLMKSPDASSHHNHLVTSQVWLCSVNVLLHYLYL